MTANTRGYSTAGMVKKPNQFSHKLILAVNIYWVIPVPFFLLVVVVMMMMMRIIIIIISLNPASDLGTIHAATSYFHKLILRKMHPLGAQSCGSTLYS